MEEKSDINGFRRPLAASYTRLSVRLRRVLQASYMRLKVVLVDSKKIHQKKKGGRGGEGGGGKK